MEESAPGFRRPPWQSFREALDAAGFRPSKTRGQNFLLDSNMVRAIVRDSGVGPGDAVLEVGAGCGFLSAHLAARGVELVAVEIEPRLLEVARGLLADYPGVRWILADVLESKSRLCAPVLEAIEGLGAWRLVSNLPYSIAGPLLVLLSRLDRPPESATVLVQRELAERIAARPGEGAYGSLTAKLAVRYRSELLRRVRAELFWPRPRVDSAVIRLERIEGAPEGLEEYDALVDGLFRQRRKGLQGLLRGLLGASEPAERLLAEAGIEGRRRPGELSSEELLGLSASPIWRQRAGRTSFGPP